MQNARFDSRSKLSIHGSMAYSMTTQSRRPLVGQAIRRVVDGIHHAVRGRRAVAGIHPLGFDRADLPSGLTGARVGRAAVGCGDAVARGRGVGLGRDGGHDGGEGGEGGDELEHFEIYS